MRDREIHPITVNRYRYSEQRSCKDFVISSLAAINVTEKRGCEYFSDHIHALKNAPKTDENVKIRETIEKSFPEAAGHD